MRIKRSIALLIRNGDRVLSVRRPDADDELPGVWGVPAGSYRNSETVNDLVTRIGRDKLGVTLRPTRPLAQGRQQRERYVLEMELWEAEIVSGTLRHPEMQWTDADTFQDGIAQGSLCCQLAAGVLKN